MVVLPSLTDSDSRLLAQLLYDHFLYCVQMESPEDVIERFRQLFIDGTHYSDPRIRAALLKIAVQKEAVQEFPSILNRCCHILLNRWQMHPKTQSAIAKLIALFENLPHPRSAGRYTGRGIQQLRQLIHHFVTTEQYLTLQRLARATQNEQEQEDNNSQPRLVANLINRYPFLHEHCLLSEDSSYEHRQTVRNIQYHLQRKFELNLSQYVTYQVRLAQLLRQNKSLSEANRLITPIRNPTLLTDRELGISLKHYVGKVNGGYTYRDLAQSFLSHTHQVPTYLHFKKDFYEYLISSVDAKYGKRQFNQRLYQQLKNTLPQCDTQRPSEFLILRTTSQLLNFLVVESHRRPSHYLFVDMITNLGSTGTIGLLLKIVLICRKVKPYLEKRFSILFSHYEATTREGVPWLIKSFDNLHLAFSVHFGSVDLSFLRQFL